MKAKNYLSINILLIVTLVVVWILSILKNGFMGGLFCIAISIIAMAVYIHFRKLKKNKINN